MVRTTTAWCALIYSITNVHEAPQGTIVHPSVYMILDVYRYTILKSRDLSHGQQIDRWRSKTHASGGEFWDNNESLHLENNDPIQILVCGDTGVGKSTLINSVFGVEVVR